MRESGPEPAEQYLRGISWPAHGDTPYPRADLNDARLPSDIRTVAMSPVGVRLELVGDATALEIRYTTATADVGHRGESAGTTFSVWRNGEQVDEQRAVPGRTSVHLALGAGDDRAVVYLPEAMQPRIDSLTAIGGDIRPAPAQPRWVAYGDSIVEGWVARGPAFAWPAIAGREHGLDIVNLGYAGSARGEIATAEQLAALDAEVISLSWGTNCWSRVPHSADMIRATTVAFLAVVRAAHPAVPIVVISPLIRPDAEATPNVLGATLDDLRRAMEEAVDGIDDDVLTLVQGRDLLGPAQLADGVHPSTDGHRRLARELGPVITDTLRRTG